MSTTASPMSLRQARAVASEMIEALRPHCHRVEVAGSIRRGRDWVNDGLQVVAVGSAMAHNLLLGVAFHFQH